AEEEYVGPVGQRHERNDLVRRRRLEGSGQQERGVSRPSDADAAAQVVDLALAIDAQGAGDRARGPAVEAGDDHPVDVVSLYPRGSQASGERLLAEARVLGLAEALLPLLRAAVARRPPALDELRGRGAGAQELGHHAAIGLVAH